MHLTLAYSQENPPLHIFQALSDYRLFQMKVPKKTFLFIRSHHEWLTDSVFEPMGIYTALTGERRRWELWL